MTASANFNPELSVIVPVYNVAPYLRKCLDSILNQTFKNIEIIIVSDGPEEDNKICAEYAAKDSRIIFIKDIGKGLGGARNAGIDIARGKYIAFVDSDDWLEPEYLEKMHSAMQSSSKIDLVQCGTNIVFEGKTDLILKRNDENYFAINQSGEFKLKNDFFGKINVGSWNKLYKKELIKKYNLRFPEKMCNEDAYFSWAYFSICQNVYFIPDKLYNYLRRNNSLMALTFNKSLGEKVLHHLQVGEMFYNFLQKNKLWNKRKDAFWNAYIVCWWFICNNADEPTKEVGYAMAKKLLSNKKIPKNQHELQKIKTLSYSNFNSGNSSSWKESICFCGLTFIKIFHKTDTARYKLFGILPIIKTIFSNQNKEIKFLGLTVYKRTIINNHKKYYLFGLPYKSKKLNHKFYNINGTNNKIIIVENGSERTLEYKETIPGLNISIAGSNNTIKLHKPYKFNNYFWDIDSQNASIEIFENTEINNFNVRCKFGYQQQLTIGAHTTIAGANANLDENSGLILGKNCMLGGYIFFAPSDGHSILDKTSNTIINSIKHPILIGDNVWIGAYSIILKNTSIPNNTIIAASSVVSKSFTDENTIIGGNPAKIIKKNVIWNRTNPFFLNKYLEIETSKNDTLYQSIPDCLGKDCLWKLIKDYEFESVLDLGAGEGIQSRFFQKNGKKVTAIVGDETSNFKKENFDNINLVFKDFLKYTPTEKFDCIWASHILEHQFNIGLFLDKTYNSLKDNGILALTVPPRETLAGGGHLYYFSPGNLIYHLLCHGFDLRNMRLKEYGYNLSIICHKRPDFTPLQSSFAEAIRTFENYLPAYVSEQIQHYRNEHPSPWGGHERIPENINYEW